MGIFDSISPQGGYPHVHPSFVVFARLAQGLGTIPFRVDVRLAAGGQFVAGTLVQQLVFPDRDAIVNMVVTMKGVSFPQPGIFLVELVLDNRWMADTTVRCGLDLILCRLEGLQALLSGALAGLNLRVVRGKSFAFEKLRLARTERLALMICGRLLHRAHADVSSFQFHGEEISRPEQEWIVGREQRRCPKNVGKQVHAINDPERLAWLPLHRPGRTPIRAAFTSRSGLEATPP